MFFELAFEAAGRRQLLRVTQQIQTGRRGHVWLTAVGEDAGAEVVSWTQRPAAGVLEERVEKRRWKPDEQTEEGQMNTFHEEVLLLQPKRRLRGPN